jgi:protein-tyrosine phosphatase
MGSAGEPGAPVPAVSVDNLRDLGGWAAADGRVVAHGHLYRSAQLSRLDPAEPAIAGLGIRSVFDFRTEIERDAQPDQLPTGATVHVLDILADSPAAAPAEMLQIIADPSQAEAKLGDGQAEVIFENAYREAISLPSAGAGYRAFYEAIAEDPHRPALFHCTTGKDRTGWCAASLLLLLGVSDDDVVAEYLLTNVQLLPALQPFFDDFAAKGGNPDVLLPVFGVRPQYLQAALDEMRARHGTIDAYLADIGVSARAIDAIRSALLVER